MVFVAAEQAFEVEQPVDGAFHDPAVFVATQRPAVLSRLLLPAAAVGTDEFNAALVQRLAQPVCVGGSIIDQSLRTLAGDLNIDQRIDRMNFSGVTASWRRFGSVRNDGHEPHTERDEQLEARSRFR